MTKLVRNNSTEVTDTEFLEFALDEIIHTVDCITDDSQASEVLEKFADVLALMHGYCVRKNINPSQIVDTAIELRSNKGSFGKLVEE